MSINQLSKDLIEATKKVLTKEEEYKDFFKKAMKKFGISSPGELSGDKEKEAWDWIENKIANDMAIINNIQWLLLSESSTLLSSLHIYCIIIRGILTAITEASSTTIPFSSPSPSASASCPSSLFYEILA